MNNNDRNKKMCLNSCTSTIVMTQHKHVCPPQAFTKPEHPALSPAPCDRHTICRASCALNRASPTWLEELRSINFPNEIMIRTIQINNCRKHIIRGQRPRVVNTWSVWPYHRSLDWQLAYRVGFASLTPSSQWMQGSC